MERAMYDWDVTMQSKDGQIHQTRYQAPWNPEKDFITPISIAEACAAQATADTHGEMEYRGIAATLIETTAPAIEQSAALG